MVTAADDTRLAVLETKMGALQEGQRQILSRLDAMQQMFNTRMDTMQQQTSDRFDAIQQMFNAQMDAMQQHTSDRFDAMQQMFNARMDAMQQMFNARFDRLQLAIWSIGGGVILTLIGLLITQIIQGK